MDVEHFLFGITLTKEAGKTKGEDSSQQFFSVVDTSNRLQFLLNISKLLLHLSALGLNLLSKRVNFSFKLVTACFSGFLQSSKSLDDFVALSNGVSQVVGLSLDGHVPDFEVLLWGQSVLVEDLGSEVESSGSLINISGG